jgi:hypothetical protein
MQFEGGASKLLLVAAASAAASSLITYAVFRLHGGMGSSGRRSEEQREQRPLEASTANGELRLAPPTDPHDPSPRVG